VETSRFFDGFDLADPGLVYVSLWRPDSPADVPADPSQFANLVGVAQKALVRHKQPPACGRAGVHWAGILSW
jgi:S-adenosyl methyltransferase